MDKSHNDKSRQKHFVMPLVFGVYQLNRIPSLHCLTRALSLSIITIVVNKGSRDQAYIESGKVLGTRLTFTKIKKIPTDRPYPQTQGRVMANKHFLGPVLGKLIFWISPFPNIQNIKW